MNTWRVGLIAVWFLCTGVLAQEQLALRLNEKGIMKILNLALQYNTASKEARTFIIPQNIYKFTIPKKDLLSNPVVPVINEISDLNLNKDLDFYFNTSDIRVTGDVDQRTLSAEIFNSSDAGFDLRLSLQLPKVEITGAKLSLCEDKQKGLKKCGSGLKVTLNQLRITTISRPVKLSLVLRLRTDGKVARVIVRSVDSNLDHKQGPNLDISFKSIEVPAISIVIDGQESQLDTSRLKDEILQKKSFLAQKLLDFASEFIAGDVAEMLNIYLVNKSVATSYEVYRKDFGPVKFDEFLSLRDYPLVDNTYVRPSVRLIQQPNGPDPVAAMMSQISEIIRNAQVEVSLRKISTPGNKDIELGGLLNFIINGRRMNVRNTLANSSKPLPTLELQTHRNYDINLALSEPLLNGALDVANTTNLFQEIFEAISPVPGFSIRSVKAHFWGDRSLIAVINAQVDLNKLKSKGVKSWFKNKIAAWLERNNNSGVIYFPIEVMVVPVIKTLGDGGTGLDLRVLSPFNYTELPNRFKYPTNVPEMTKTVKDGVMDELKTSLEPHTNKTYSVDLTKFLNQSGVIFRPKTISINQGAYLMMNLDLVDIKFSSLNPNGR